MTASDETQRGRRAALKARLRQLAELPGADAPSSPSSLAAGLIGGIVGAAALHALRHRPAGLLAASGLGAAAGAAAANLRRRQRRRAEVQRSVARLPAPSHPAPAPAPSPDASLDISGLSPLFTPPSDFYVTDVAFPAPRIDPASWTLRVNGLVERPLTLTLGELLAMELTELDATLACVHNPVGGPRIGTGRWLGIRVADLLERAGVKPDAEQLVAHSVDGFTAGVPLDHLTDGRDALIAVGLAANRCPPSTGFPLACLFPACGAPTPTPSGWTRWN